ncbi:hypothetical protein ACLB2K_040208 [Fragaria x ananassa]
MSMRRPLVEIQKEKKERSVMRELSFSIGVAGLLVTLSAVTRYCPLWARRPSRFCFRQLRSSFPVGHPSWDCSSINMLNLGVPIPSEAAEPPKGLAVEWRNGPAQPHTILSALGPPVPSAPGPHGFVSGSSQSNFPVGHPSWDCSGLSMLNFGVPIPSEATVLELRS